MKTYIRTLLAAMVLASATLAAQAENVAIKGSNTFGEKLAPLLIKAYQEKYPDRKVEIEVSNSAYGIFSLLEGGCDIAASSRILNEDELRISRSENITLTSHAVGYYGIAIVVNAKSALRNLTSKQVRDIFSGAITNWSTVGGPDAPIAVHISSSQTGTYLGFQELALSQRAYRKDAQEHNTYAEISAAVGQDPNAIGFTAMSMVDTEQTHALSINGIAPSQLALSENIYPYARLLRLYTIKTKGERSSPALRFVRFVRSAAGQRILEEAGFVRHLAVNKSGKAVQF